MSSLKSAVLCALAGALFAPAQTAKERNAPVAGPVALVSDAVVNYCFARVRGLDAERQPQSYIDMRLDVTLSYRNPGNRPLILPTDRETHIFYALSPGQMTEYEEGLGLFEPTLKAMKHLPTEVSPASPLDPPNGLFTVIPAGGALPTLVEEISVPVNRPGFFHKNPDLRGRRVYVELRFEHRPLDPGLQTDLSDRWGRFGVPWSGTVTTNTIQIDVPAAPQGARCVDIDKPAHPAIDTEDTK